MMRTIGLLSLVLFLSQMAWSQNRLVIPDTLSGSSINLNLQKGQVMFYDGQMTNTMGINGAILGPTLLLTKHQQVAFNLQNNLGEPTTIHWHGMHVAPENDGGPHVVINPGETWSPAFEVLDHAATMWYHPHLHHKTFDHVQMGMAGFIFVRDEHEAALNLPRTYGVDDIPLAIQTKALDNYQIVTTHSALDTSLFVNGTVNPFMDVPAQVVRLRILNGAAERVFNFGFSGNKTFHLIGTDNGLLPAPLALTRLMLAPGERAEILVNLEGMNGQQVFLMNYGQEIPSATYGASQPGMGPGQTIPNYTSNPINGSNRNILQLNVVAQTANAVTTIPGNLVTVTPWNEANAVQTRTFTFMSMTQGQDAINGPFTINNEHFDMGVINFEVPFENLEIWELRNQSPIAHPFHVHNVPFYVLSVNGNQPAAHLRGRKDVILVPGGNTTVRIILKFEDFYNDSLPYMYHCHMLTHEDDGMMGQFLVKAPCELLTSGPQNFSGKTGGTAQFSVQVTDTTGVFYQWQVNSGTGFQDLQDAGQFSNTRTATLNVSNLAPFNDNQLYRSVLSGPCDIISPTALLNVSDTGTSGLYLPELSFHLHPNPTHKTINLRLDSNTAFTGLSYQILDVTGRKVMHGSLDEATEWMFDVRELPEGLYFFRFTDGKSGMTRKFVKSSTSAF